MDRSERRLRRQVDAIGRAIPAARQTIRTLVAPRRRWLRLPLALLLILGGVFSFLPVLGIWMLPLGLLLLALDLPPLRPVMSRLMIWIRRKLPPRLRQRHPARPSEVDHP